MIVPVRWECINKKGKHFMVQVQTQRRRSWAGLIWLSIVAFSLLIAAINGYTILLLLAGAIAVASIIILGTYTTNRKLTARVIWQPMAQRTISSAAGTEQPALVASIERDDGYQMVLTVEGYKLIDEAGQVVYTLKRR
jgi:hypothetical protein